MNIDGSIFLEGTFGNWVIDEFLKKVLKKKYLFKIFLYNFWYSSNFDKGSWW